MTEKETERLVLRTARILFERAETFSRIQKRARAFEWDAPLQARADAWASDELSKLAEEVQKGLSGLVSGHVGRSAPRAFSALPGRPLSLAEQVRAGLRLYAATVRILGSALRPPDRAVVSHALRLIESAQLP